MEAEIREEVLSLWKKYNFPPPRWRMWLGPTIQVYSEKEQSDFEFYDHETYSQSHDKAERWLLDCASFMTITTAFLKQEETHDAWGQYLVQLSNYNAIDHKKLNAFEKRYSFDQHSFYDAKQYLITKTISDKKDTTDKIYYVGFVPDTSFEGRDILNGILVTTDWTVFARLLWKHTIEIFPISHLEQFFLPGDRGFRYSLYHDNHDRDDGDDTKEEAKEKVDCDVVCEVVNDTIPSSPPLKRRKLELPCKPCLFRSCKPIKKIHGKVYVHLSLKRPNSWIENSSK